MSKELNVTLTRTVEASQKACFEAWLNPETIKAFMTNCQGTKVTRAEVDARVGGKFLIVMEAGEKKIPHEGVYETVDKFGRLSFTWLSEHQTLKDSLVTLDFKALGPKTTELTLRHVGFTSDSARKAHEGGWTDIMNGLVGFFAGG